MTARFSPALVLFTVVLFTGCGSKPDAPAITLTSYEGSTITLNEKTALTAVYFFSMSNPVALGVFDRLPDQLNDAAEAVAVAMHVDRPPNVGHMQQRRLIPIVIDEGNRISGAFGGVDLTPAIYLVKEGKIMLHQRGRLDYDALNATIVANR